MRQRNLACESLEAREVPSAVSINFETDRAPYAPAGWQQWASNNSQYYSVNRSVAHSGAQSISAFGTVNVESRLWQPVSQAGDVKLSLAVRADTPAPITLYGRGASLNAASASYQGVAISRGGAVELREVTNGSVRSVKTIVPTVKVPNAWLKVSLEFRGSQAIVQVQRADTQQFLNANGAWQSAATNAISQSVAAKTTGFVGVGRLSGDYGVAYFDDFSATPIVVSTPITPTTPTGPTTPTIPTTPTTPSTPTTPTPSTPSTSTDQKFDHIRIAQLAYGGQNITAVEQQLFNDTVDLIVSNPSYLDEFESADAATRKTVYSNASNMYEGLLTSWLDFTDRTGTNREVAFYHVAQATPFSGSSSSAMPVTWFWNAVRTTANGSATNITSNARGTQTAGVTFGTPGEAIAVGSVDEFREINVTITKTAGAGFTGTWEYASAVDASGKVTAWKSLPILGDGTNGLKQNGRITFNPPVDWVTGRINTDRLSYVRFRTITGSAASAPVVKSILGRDYVNANGTIAGTIPAFDKLADSNNDGYLNDAEYATRRSGFEARFVSESRLFYPFYGQMRFVVNPTFDSVKQWEGEYHADVLAKTPLADGLFLDNQNGRLPFSTPVLESTANYSTEAAALVAAIKDAIDDRTIIVNTAGALTGTEPAGVTREAGIAFEEFLLRPTTANWSMVNDVANVVKNRLAASPTAEVILDSLPGSAGMLDARTRMGVLSYYYLVGDPDRTYLMFFGGHSPASSWQSRWVPAASKDVGQPKTAMSTFASGLDPANTQLHYKVYGREYDNALVLFKPLSYAIGKGSGTTANATATTHQLNGNYRVLNADGSMGPVVRSITLRNGEGAVLMKA